HFGSGRSRGLGQVTAEISNKEKHGRPGGFVTSTIRASQRSDGKKEPSEALWGMGAWLNDGAYGTAKDDSLALAKPVERTARGIRQLRVFTSDALESLQQAAINDFIQRMQNWSPDKGTPTLPVIGATR